MIQNRHKIIARVEKFWGENLRILLMNKKHLSILKHITVSPSKSMILARVSGRIKKDTGERIEPHILSKILKEDLNLSYKRGYSAPTQAFSSANNEMKVYTS